MLPYPHIDPTALELGPLKLRWYGLMYLIGFASGWLLGRWRAAKAGSGWKPEEVDDLISFLILGLLLGARLGYVLFYDFPVFAANPLEIVKIWKGGMSFHGGVAGVCMAFWLFARRTGRPFRAVADFIVPFAPIGLFAGRIGNFINGELWGRPADVPWAMVFPDLKSGLVPRHPSQLYEAGLEGIALFLILFIFSRKKRPLGAVGGLFCLGYGVFRSFCEFFRQPDPQLGFVAFGWLSMGQLLSLPLILIGAGLLIRAYTVEARRNPVDQPAKKRRTR
jgi:phosphatidylglycerol:prolipoprotein diacylglycerol transferase